VLGWSKRYNPELDAAHRKVQRLASVRSFKGVPHELGTVVEMV
jgi:hypothetical protein